MHRMIGPWLAIWTLMAYLLPNHYEPWRSFHQEAAAFLAFMPLCSVAVHAPKLDIRLTSILSLLALSPLIQFATGQIYFSGDALVHMYYMAAALLTALAGYARIDVLEGPSAKGVAPPASDPLSYLFAAILLASIVSVGLALHQWLELNRSGLFIVDLPPGARPYGNLAQPNHFSLLLSLGMVVVWMMWELRRLGNASACITQTWLLVGVVLANSRAFWLGALCFLVIFILMRAKCKLRLSYAMLIILLCGLFVLQQGKEFLYQVLMQGDDPLVGPRIQSIESRLMIWRVLLNAVFETPVVGYGWGMVAYAQLKHALLAPEHGELFFYAHNWLLDVMVFVGVPVALAVLGFGLTWAVRACYACTDARTVATVMVPLVVVAYSMVEFQYAYSYFLLPSAYCMGLALSRRPMTMRWEEISRVRIRNFIQRSSIGLALVLTCGLGVAIAADYSRFERIWLRERFVMAGFNANGQDLTYEPMVLNQLKGILDLERVKIKNIGNELDLKSIESTAARYPYVAFVMKWAEALRLNGRGSEGQKLIDLLCLREGAARCLNINQSLDGKH